MQTDVCTLETAEAMARFLISISKFYTLPDAAGDPVTRQNGGGGRASLPQLQGLWGLKPPMRCEQEDSRRTLWDLCLPREGGSHCRAWPCIPVPSLSSQASTQELITTDVPPPHVLIACSWDAPGPPWDAAVTLYLVTRGGLDSLPPFFNVDRKEPSGESQQSSRGD